MGRHRRGSRPAKSERPLTRLSCVECGEKKRKCEYTAKHNDEPIICARCAKLGLQCLFVQRRKPGRTGAKERYIGLDDILFDSGSGGCEFETVPGSTEPPTPVSIYPEPHQWAIVPLALPLDTFPTQEMLDLVMSGFLDRMYLSFPVCVRPVLLTELDTPGYVPPFGYYSILLWSARFDPELADSVGEGERSRLLSHLFNQASMTLLPAIEKTLAGPPILSGPLFDGYSHLAIWTLVSLVHLLAVAARNLENDPAPALADFSTVVNLCVQLCKTSGILSAPHLHRRSLKVPFGGASSNTHFAIERAKRAWSALVIMDNNRAAMTASAPSVPGSMASSSAWGLSEAEQSATVEAELSAIFNNLTLDDPTNASYQQDLMDLRTPSDAVRERFRSLFRSEALMSFSRHSLAIVAHRLLNYRPYTSCDDQWQKLRDELRAIYDGIVDDSADDDSPSSSNQRLQTHLEQAENHFDFASLVYHALMVLLASPQDGKFLHPEADQEWIDSPAFLIAQEHAIKATRILEPFAQGTYFAPQMFFPFFQYAVLRTGLVHFLFLKQAAMFTDPSSHHHLVEESARQLEIHTVVLRKGGERVLGSEDKESVWYATWKSITGLG